MFQAACVKAWRQNNVVKEELKGGQYEHASHIRKSTWYLFINLKKKALFLIKKCAMNQLQFSSL